MGRMRNTWVVRVGLVAAALLTLVHAPLPSAAVDFRGMEENCILSFVVPRDKVKSSCDMEARVTRRLNAMETKVTLYKQHVQELQEQLSKERQSHAEEMEEIQRRLNHPQDIPENVLLEKRIMGLEEELRKIRAAVASSGRAGVGEKARGSGLGVAGRSREEEEKAITVLVKTVVHSEVQKLFDNYTHYVSRIVQDQALAFSQIMNMVPRHHNKDLSQWSNSKPDKENQPQSPPDRNKELINQIESLKIKLNGSGKGLADHHHYSNAINVSIHSQPTPPPSHPSHSKPAPSSPDFNNIHDSLPDINDTASGDANESFPHNNITFPFTRLPNNETDRAENSLSLHDLSSSGDSESLYPGGKDIASAQSRMSYNADLNKLPDPSEEDGNQGKKPEPSNLSGWQESMVHDQSTGQWIQEMLRMEVAKLLEPRLEEVAELVVKHNGMVDGKLHDTQLRFSQLEQRLAADIKHLSQVVGGLKLEVSSVSQGLQSLQSRVERAEELEGTVMEMKKNMSQEGGSRLLATLLDEQGKKVRKMERLTDIYKQSLEHYRNETKMEYRDVRDRLGKEVSVLRAQQGDLYLNLTTKAQELVHTLNVSASQRLEEVKQRVQVMEDTSLLQQIDLSNFERQMKSRAAKAERDLNRLGQDVGELKNKARNLQKNLNGALDKQGKLSNALNSTSLKMRHLQMEVQLNVLDDWVPYNFDYMKTRTDCFGDQYIRKSGFKTGRLVGVVLCTNKRYKIFLGQNLVDTFKNIGDDSGMGEDHCQFVNARSMSKVKVSPFRTSTETEPGYVRTHWGQEPRPELLNIIRPSPAWYECGVSIP